MDIKLPFLHKHHLPFDYYENHGPICDECNQRIGSSWAYCCETCNYDFWLHSSCAEKILPYEISRPNFHSLHHLTLCLFDYLPDFICDKCFTLSRGHQYRCLDCPFNVDVFCAAANYTTNDDEEKEKSQRSWDDQIQGGLRNIYHFVHHHELAGIFNYRKVAKEHCDCVWCGKHLSGPSYGCFQFKCQNFYIHESCLIKVVPTKILGNPFHFSHPLYIQKPTKQRVENSSSKPCCNACKDEIWKEAYCCEKCEFRLHALCSRLQPTLKDEHIHHHTLTYFRIQMPQVTYQCNMCHTIISAKSWENIFFYRCVQCDLNFHFECLKISPSVAHEYHRHPLILTEQFKEDDFEEYYCDICEKERNPKYHVYCCKECTYVAHIECTLKKVDSKALIPKLMEQEVTEKSNAESQSHDIEKQIDHFTHRHPLSYYEVTEEKEDLLCRACNLGIYGEAYGCERCKYYLHNKCAKLSFEVLHPLHPQRSLQLCDENEPFLCDECYDFSNGFRYVCYFCNFTLDVKCATLAGPNNEGRIRLKDQVARETKLCPFEQDHELVFFNARRQLEQYFNCSICLLPLSGPCYYCIPCGYVLHKSCLGFPRQIRLPLLSEHPLHPVLNSDCLTAACFACHKIVEKKEIFYHCESPYLHKETLYNCVPLNVHLNLHLLCAKSLRRAVESKSHEHPLFYFGKECHKLFAPLPFTRCEKCKKSFIAGVPFYRCIFCNINFHLECALIPQFIEAKRHIHTLILKDCFIEDDSRENYCDICEEERHPKHHVYYCEECQGLFVAHIECVLNNMFEEREGGVVLDPQQMLEVLGDILPIRRWQKGTITALGVYVAARRSGQKGFSCQKV